jgi:hypothetical protein
MLGYVIHISRYLPITDFIGYTHLGGKHHSIL